MELWWQIGKKRNQEHMSLQCNTMHCNGEGEGGGGKMLPCTTIYVLLCTDMHDYAMHHYAPLWEDRGDEGRDCLPLLCSTLHCCAPLCTVMHYYGKGWVGERREKWLWYPWVIRGIITFEAHSRFCTQFGQRTLNGIIGCSWLPLI